METIKSILLTTSMYTHAYKSIALYKLTSQCLHPKLCAPIEVLIFVQEILKTKDVSQKIAKLTKS